MKINESNYFSKKASMEYMSVSQYKTFCECEARGLAEARGKYVRPKTTALLEGSYVDACLTGDRADFIAKNADNILKRDGSLKAEFIGADNAVSALKRSPLLVKLLNGEHQRIMTGSISGVAVKIKVDSLLPDRIVDLKYMRDFKDIYVDEEGRVPWYEAWKYDLQGAVYQEIIRQNLGKRLPFTLVAVTKETVPDVAAIEIDQALLDYNIDVFSSNVERFDAIKKRIIKPEACWTCDYCKKIKKITRIVSTEELNDGI